MLTGNPLLVKPDPHLHSFAGCICSNPSDTATSYVDAQGMACSGPFSTEAYATSARSLQLFVYFFPSDPIIFKEWPCINCAYTIKQFASSPSTLQGLAFPLNLLDRLASSL